MVDQPPGSSPLAATSFTRHGIRRGMRIAIPMGIGVGIYGVAFGLLAQQTGLSWAENLLMNVTVFAGAALIVSLEQWSYPLPVLSIVVTTLLVNIRLLLLGAAAWPWLRSQPSTRVYPMLHIMADEGWAIAMNDHRKGERDIGVFLGANLFIGLCWIPTVVIGHMAGSGVGDPAAIGLDFAFTTIFAATLAGSYRHRLDLIPWGAAGIAALLASWLLPGTWYVIIGGLTGFAVAWAISPAGTGTPAGEHAA